MSTQLDELKKRWKGLESAADATGLGRESAMRAAAGSARSRRDYLLRVYRLFCILGAVWVVLTPIVFGRAGLPVWVSCLTSAYFCLTSVVCFSVWRKIRALDFGRMTTVELLRQVRGIIATRRRKQFLLCVCMLPILAVMFYYFRVSTPMLVGAISGAVIGGVIGIANDRKIRRNLRDLSNELMAAYE